MVSDQCGNDARCGSGFSGIGAAGQHDRAARLGRRVLQAELAHHLAAHGRDDGGQLPAPVERVQFLGVGLEVRGEQRIGAVVLVERGEEGVGGVLVARLQVGLVSGLGAAQAAVQRRGDTPEVLARGRAAARYR